MTVNELTEKLGLNELKNRDWSIQACCAKSGFGLYAGLDWLSAYIANKSKKHWIDWHFLQQKL